MKNGIRRKKPQRNRASILLPILGKLSIRLLVNACVLTAYYATSAVAEERELLLSHEGYQTYRDRTGMFLPRLTGR